MPRPTAGRWRAWRRPHLGLRVSDRIEMRGHQGGRTMRLSRVLLVWALLPAWCLAADEAQVIPLWPSGAPGSEGKTDPEVVTERGKDGVHDRHISRVHNPTLTVYLPPREKANGAAVVICPGGAHRILAIDHEGYDVARRLNEMGVAGIVLKY